MDLRRTNIINNQFYVFFFSFDLENLLDWIEIVMWIFRLRAETAQLNEKKVLTLKTHCQKSILPQCFGEAEFIDF